MAGLHSLSGILSSGLLGSFALLGVFPILARWTLARLMARRIYALWPKPKRFDRNLLVIGAASAGLGSAYNKYAVGA